MDHYEALGVPKSAAPADIKRAYRKRASKAHPDRGGSDEEMARLNRALAVLEDPDRRAQYDATGQDSAGPTIEQRARAAMLSMFQQTIEQTDENAVSVVGRAIAQKQREMLQEQHKVQGKRERFVKKTGKIKTKGGVENLAAAVIEQQVKHCDSQLAQIADIQQVMAMCAEMLKAYTDETPAEESRHFAWFTTATGSATAGGWR